jgi:osmotically-inducible protein OsmY
MQTIFSTSGLSDQLQIAVVQHPHLKQRNVRLETHTDGQVTIRGQVYSYFEKQMAQEALRHIEGVTEIVNQLDVTCWTES